MVDYWKLTVPKLRIECKRLGLPAYQHKGKRLRKADLVEQLENVRSSRVCGEGRDRPLRRSTSRTTPEPSRPVQSRDKTPCGSEFVLSVGPTVETYAVEPARPKPQRSTGRVPTRRRTDADRLVQQLATMPATPAETMALARVLSGTATGKHDGILKRREAKACQVLAAKAKSTRCSRKWHERYLAATGVMT